MQRDSDNSREMLVGIFNTGKQISINVSLNSTVQEVKKKIYDKAGLLPEEIRVLYAGKHLVENQWTLNDYEIDKDDTCFIVITFQEWLERINLNDLKLLDFNKCEWVLTDDKLKQLIPSLKANTTVETIDLRHNQLTIDSIYAIADLLSKNRTIKSILLEGNPCITDSTNDDEANRIIQGVIEPLLQRNRGEEITCTDVDLHKCRHDLITNVFFPLLPHYKNLLSLNLSHLNQDNKFFFQSLTLYLYQRSTVIRHLNLSYNKISAEALYELSSVMLGHDDTHGNKSLQTLNLSHNRISVCRLTLEKRFKIFIKNPNIIKIDLSANFLNPDCDEILHDKDGFKLRKNDKGSNSCLSLYYSAKNNPYVKSILNPKYKLKIAGSNAFVVAFGCSYTKHAAIFLETLRKSGQRLLNIYDQIPNENGNLCIRSLSNDGWGRILSSIEDFNRESFQVDSRLGVFLKDNIYKEEKHNPKPLSAYFFERPKPCVKWAINQLKEIGIYVSYHDPLSSKVQLIPINTFNQKQALIDQNTQRINKNAPNFFIVDLNENRMSDNDCKELFAALEQNTVVHTLDLRNNQLTVESIYGLAHLLSVNTTIETVLLDNNPLLNEEAYRIIDGVIEPLLQHRRGEAVTCEAVDLHGCEPELVQLVRDIFLRNISYYHKLLALNLSHLNQSNNFFFPTIKEQREQDRPSLTDYLIHNHTLLSLNLSHNQLDYNRALFEIASAMEDNQTLMDIDLSHNQMMTNRLGLTQIKDDLSVNPHLTNIYVTGNFLAKNCDTVLSSQASNNPSTLFYSDPNIHDQWNLKSLLNPAFQINTRRWVAAIVCHQEKSEHSRLLIEGMRKSGQRFLRQYHLLPKKGKFNSNKANVYAEDYCHFNSDHWYVQAHEITHGQGKSLCTTIDAELSDELNYALFPKRVKNATKSRHAVNCCTWCCEKMKEVGIPVNEGLIPSITAKKDPKSDDEKSIWQRIFHI